MTPRTDLFTPNMINTDCSEDTDIPGDMGIQGDTDITRYTDVSGGTISSGLMATPDPATSCASARRGFLRSAGVLSLSATAGILLSGTASQQAYAAPAVELDPVASRRIHLINAHTGDDLDVVYYTRGIYIDENIERLNHLMRDRRANVSFSMDTALYDQLQRLRLSLGIKGAVHVLSGYRTAETNARLRRRSSGVAKYSLHMQGRAADIFIPGMPIRKLQRAALDLQAGGVGLYSKSDFIHVDTGAVRRWGN